ncbi:T9SS type A sorting domain-containing protein [Hymenobacter sp. BT730]|uniref:T9SS type A sorting domain-containing protein n=1 Tax=Hymenobacter sp. BT730 TaxID=3063332 RepID=UPI0026DFA397|nr:T9SS type A sorting domain-containing protein [Hymenobacter sp. BT730]
MKTILRLLLPIIYCLSILAAQAQSSATSLWQRLPVQLQKAARLADSPDATSILKARPLATVYLPGQSVNYTWNGTKWDEAEQVVYSYTPQGVLTQAVYSDSVTKVPTYRLLLSYDAQRRLSQIQTDTWSGTAWQNTGQVRATYDATGAVTTFITYMWMNNAWMPVSGIRTTVTRNGAGLETELVEELLQPNGSFINNGRQLYTIVNNRHTEIVYQSWVNNAWANVSRDVNIVWTDFAGQLRTSYVEQSWVNNAWQDAFRHTFSYPGNGSSVEVTEGWSGTAWVNATRSSFLCDAQGSLTTTREENWQGTAWVITSENKTLIKYGPNNEVVREVHQQLNTTTNTFVNVSRTNNSNFQAFSVTANRQAQRADQGRLYPNPAADAALLELNGLRETTPLQAEMINALGQVVRTQRLQPRQGAIRATLNLRGLPAGVYSIRLRTSEGAVVQRLLHR